MCVSLAAHAWSKSHQLEGEIGPGDLDCPTTGLCVAATTLKTYAYAGGRWFKIKSNGLGPIHGPLSCAASGFCMTVDDGGADKLS
jgi:hypothetical protein